MIALFGSKGFVGSEVLKSLKEKGYEVYEVTRDNFEEILRLDKEFDYVINAACPGARFKANTNPSWDFEETVKKTAKIFYETKFKKFIQISSVSARCQPDTVYGRNRLAAESVVNDGNSLIVRIGPMYGPTLKKGVLIDMLNNSKVYASSESKYSFTPIKFNADWIADNLDKKGVWEVGSKNSIKLGTLVKKLGLNIEFEGEIDNQEIKTIQKNYPDVNLVIDFIKNHEKYKK
ncbi:MAG TPA: NAD(P)-dependent oxidoreductase [Candidatus Pacearchaeota archaeon]|nr:NAD(P)-dependent oxidoreductase [Candidatus Pacearchaeota archaeon]